MGSQQSKETKPNSAWQWVETENGLQIYRNKEDGRMAERRRVMVSSTYALSQQNKIYSFRSYNPYGWVKSYEIVKIQDAAKEKDKISDICRCGNQRIQLDVYTQRIQYRLSQLPQLAFPQSLLLLKQTVIGFEVLYQKVGGLHINPELIGITEKGEIRVWVNQNWAVNRPSHKIPILKSSSSKEYLDSMMPELRDEQEMVSNLVSVISQKTENGHFPQAFDNQLRTKGHSFKSIKKFLNEYVSTNKITLPTIIQKKKDSVNNGTRNLDIQYANSNNYIKSGPINALPPQSGQQNFQVPKFSFNNTVSQPNNTSSSINFRQQPSYKPFQFKPFPTFNSLFNPSTTTPIINFNNPISKPLKTQIKQFTSTYKPYLPQSNNQIQPSKTVQSEHRFNLPNKYELEARPIEAKHQSLSSSAILKSESPKHTLIQLAENEGQTIHNASYKILNNGLNDIRT